MSQNLIAWEYDQFKERALQHPDILSVTGISHVLGDRDGESWKIYPANIPRRQEKSTLTLHVNHDFSETFGIEIIAGRDFSEEFHWKRKNMLKRYELSDFEHLMFQSVQVF